MFGVRASCFLAVTLCAATVSAAPPSRSAQVEVTFSTPVERTEFRLQGPGIEPAGKACSGPCTLELQPGTYTIYVDPADHNASVPVKISGNSAVEVRPPSQTQRTIGIALIATGSVLAAAGAAVLVYDMARSLDALRGGPAFHAPAWIAPVAIAGVVGVPTALFGIGLLTTAQPTAVVRSRAEPAHARRPTAQQTELVFVAPAFVPGGAGLRLGWRF